MSRTGECPPYCILVRTRYLEELYLSETDPNEIENGLWENLKSIHLQKRLSSFATGRETGPNECNCSTEMYI